MNQTNLTHIKQYFQEKTGVCLTDQKVPKRPLQRVALLAAVLVCCLTVAAAAASVFSGSSIVEYFRSGGAIPPGVEDVTVTFDAQVVEDYTQQVVQSVQTGEVTVTLQTVTSANTSHATFVYCVFEVAALPGHGMTLKIRRFCSSTIASRLPAAPAVEQAVTCMSWTMPLDGKISKPL